MKSSLRNASWGKENIAPMLGRGPGTLPVFVKLHVWQQQNEKQSIAHRAGLQLARILCLFFLLWNSLRYMLSFSGCENAIQTAGRV